MERWVCDCDSKTCIRVLTSNAGIGYATRAQCEAQCFDTTLGVPTAPTVARDCEHDALVVTAPAFPDNAVSLELARDDGATILHLFASAGAWSDAATAEEVAYRYRCRAVAADGARSEWGAPSAATSRVSVALTATWLLPGADGDELSGWVTLRVQLADSGETLDACGNPQLPVGACPSLDVNDADLVFTLDGLPLVPLAVARVSGTPRNGIYEARFDSRLFASGARSLAVKARGSDCCFARTARPVVASNSFDQGVRWFEVSVPVDETNAYVSLQNEPLHPHPLRRYHVQSVVCDQSATRAAWLDETVSNDDKNAAFDALLERRAVALARAGSGVTPEQTQWRGRATLGDNATALFWIQRWTPMQHLNCFNTLETGVVSLSPTGDGEGVCVFSRSGPATGAGARARLAIYDDGTLTPKFDLTAKGLGGARSVAWLHEQSAVLVVAGNGNSAGFYLLDLDAGQARYHVTLDDDARFPRWVARTGQGATARAWLLLVNSALTAKRTAIYSYAPGAIELRGELDEAVTLAQGVGETLYLATGAALWKIEDGAPVAVRVYGAAITAVGALGQTGLLVGLANGDLRDETGALLATLDGAVGAVAAWAARDSEPVRGVAGADGAHLFEQLDGGAWSDARDLPIPAGEPSPMAIDRVTALREVSRLIAPASGEPGQPGFVAEKRERELLIGTATDAPGHTAPLLVLRLAAPERIKGALLSSKVSRPAFEARAV